MTPRRLTISLQPDWRSALRHAGARARADTYQGEILNFESPGVFFSRLSEKRWALIRAKAKASWQCANWPGMWAATSSACMKMCRS